MAMAGIQSLANCGGGEEREARMRASGERKEPKYAVASLQPPYPPHLSWN